MIDIKPANLMVEKLKAAIPLSTSDPKIIKSPMVDPADIQWNTKAFVIDILFRATPSIISLEVARYYLAIPNSIAITNRNLKTIVMIA